MAGILLAGWACLVPAGQLLSTRSEPAPVSLIDLKVEPADGYVGSDVCRSCHPLQHESWRASYHSRMTQVATPETVLAPFDGTELSLEDATWRVERRGDEFWVKVSQATQESFRVAGGERRIVMTTGSHNYQLYWMDGGADGGMKPFPFVYLLYDRVWIPRKSRFLTPPQPRTPDETGRWNVHCIKCHATRGQPRGPGDETRVAELGISCEACHGPGGEHARLNHSPLRRFTLYGNDEPDPAIANPTRLAHDRATQVCAQCHGIEIFLSPEKGEAWRHEGSLYRPGDDLNEFQTIVTGRYEDNLPEVQRYIDDSRSFKLSNCFWSDGVLRVVGREYHGMLESPCYQRGEMGCLSCHEMHREAEDTRPLADWADDMLGEGMRGDAACLQCHDQYSGQDALSAHTHHSPASAGSRCLNCHMPYTTWGLLRTMRSHTVESPRVVTSVDTGRPNACNQCHLDRSLGWAADHLASWYGQEPPLLTDDEQEVAASVLWVLSGDAVQRGLMAWSMGWEPARRVSGTQWMVPYLCLLMIDDYDAIRYRAQRTLTLYPEYREIVADSVVGATRSEQLMYKNLILGDWLERFPTTDGLRDLRVLINADGRVDERLFGILRNRRSNEELVLFE